MVEKDYIITDAHFRSMKNLVSKLDDCTRFFCLGDFSENMENIELLKKKNFGENALILAGNHEEAYVKGIGINSRNFRENNSSFEEVFDEIKKKPEYYSFIQRLVEIEDEKFDNKIIDYTTIGNRKVISTHGCPIITESMGIKNLNEMLWSRLVDEKDKYIPEKILDTFELLDDLDLDGIYKGHDHAPALFVKTPSRTIAYTNFGIFEIRDNSFYLLDKSTIHNRKITIQKDHKFIFNPSPFYQGCYGTAETKNNGALELCVHNLN